MTYKVGDVVRPAHGPMQGDRGEVLLVRQDGLIEVKFDHGNRPKYVLEPEKIKHAKR